MKHLIPGFATSSESRHRPCPPGSELMACEGRLSKNPSQSRKNLSANTRQLRCHGSDITSSPWVRQPASSLSHISQP
jgi:hypothetical protein